MSDKIEAGKTLAAGKPRGTAISAVNAEDASPEARRAAMKNAEARNAPEANQDTLGPKHEFRLSYKGLSKTVKVFNRHAGQAEIEARAKFNDDVVHPALKERPNPKMVKCELLKTAA